MYLAMTGGVYVFTETTAHSCGSAPVRVAIDEINLSVLTKPHTKTGFVHGEVGAYMR